MSKQLVNPKELFDGATFGMSQATIDADSGLVFVSGQVDWNHQHEATEPSVEGQMRKALQNLNIVLKAAGSSIDKLLRIRVYIRGEFGDYLEILAPIFTEFLGESRPALTGIGVASLASVDTLVEIEAVASTK